MKFNMPLYELRKLIDEFSDTVACEEELDTTDKEFIEECMCDEEYCSEMAGDSNPYYRDLVESFKDWIKPIVRAKKISTLLDQ